MGLQIGNKRRDRGPTREKNFVVSNKIHKSPQLKLHKVSEGVLSL